MIHVSNKDSATNRIHLENKSKTIAKNMNRISTIQLQMVLLNSYWRKKNALRFLSQFYLCSLPMESLKIPNCFEAMKQEANFI